MRIPVLPDEEGRLKALRRYDITVASDPIFEYVGSLAAKIMGTQIGAVSFIDENRQLFMAAAGAQLPEWPRDEALCAFTIAQRDVLVIPDARLDERFTDSLAVRGAGLYFYAGAPLRTKDDYNIGTVCVLDPDPKLEIESDALAMLKDLAGLTVSLLDERLEAKHAYEQVEWQLRHIGDGEASSP